MQLKFNVIGQDRKRLVVAMAEAIGVKQKYLGMPTMSYQVGSLTVDINGTVTSNVEINKFLIDELIYNLKEKGFLLQSDQTEEICNKNTNNFSQITIGMPKSDFDEQSFRNLIDLVEQKKDLISKAFNTDSVEVLENNFGEILFPWFKSEVDSELLKAYSIFIEKLCTLAKSLKRTKAKNQEKELVNEKYAFRCFLLRLGFIGEEYKNERKMLLKNFEGSSAYKEA